MTALLVGKKDSHLENMPRFSSLFAHSALSHSLETGFRPLKISFWFEDLPNGINGIV